MNPDEFAAQHGEAYLTACSRIDADEREAVALEQKVARLNALVASNPALLRGAQHDGAEGAA